MQSEGRERREASGEKEREKEKGRREMWGIAPDGQRRRATLEERGHCGER